MRATPRPAFAIALVATALALVTFTPACDGTLVVGSAAPSLVGTGGGAGTGAGTGAAGTAGGAGCACGPLERCDAAGACVCAQGLVRCGDACVDVSCDERHCGGCGLACDERQACRQGVCACAKGARLCGNRCVGDDDPESCGACGRECKEGMCQQGACVEKCAQGFAACDSPEQHEHELHAICAPLATDPSNCGSCGNRCAAGTTCVSGDCVLRVPASPCMACPCATCEAALGGPGRCCPDEAGTPYCVAAFTCP